jgi:hypothetical protein
MCAVLGRIEADLDAAIYSGIFVQTETWNVL